MATKQAVGLGFAVLSAATFGTSGTFATALMDSGWTPGAAVTVRVGLAALILTGPALAQLRGRWGLVRRGLPAIAGYGLVAVAGCQLSYFNAVEHLSISVALLIEYSGTVLVVLWMWLRHAQRPRRRTVLGTVLAIGGLGLVLDLTGSHRVDAVGLLWALGGALGLAVYFVISAHSSDLLPPMVMAWGGLLVGGVALAVLGLTGVTPFHAATGHRVDLAGHHTSWIVPVIGLALFATVIAYSLGITAARQLGAKVASFVGLSEVLFATLIAWVLLGQRPTLLQGIGGVVVLAGIVLVRADATTEADILVPDLPVPAAT